MGGCNNRTRENPFFKARMEAAKYNDRLKSREGAAEALGVHPSTIANYELGTRVNPQPDTVLCMADLYHAPELLNYFCANECPIGLETTMEIKLEGLDRIAIKTLNSLQGTEKIKGDLIEIVSDGKITDDEEETLKAILDHLTQIAETASELKLWVQKNI